MATTMLKTLGVLLVLLGGMILVLHLSQQQGKEYGEDPRIGLSSESSEPAVPPAPADQERPAGDKVEHDEATRPAAPQIHGDGLERAEGPKKVASKPAASARPPVRKDPEKRTDAVPSLDELAQGEVGPQGRPGQSGGLGQSGRAGQTGPADRPGLEESRGLSVKWNVPTEDQMRRVQGRLSKVITELEEITSEFGR